MNYNEFNRVANEIKSNAITIYHSSTCDSWKDSNGNIFKVEDCGYSRTIRYNGKTYFMDYKDEINEIS